MIFLLAVIIGVLCGYLRGGRAGRVSEVPLRMWGFVPAAFIVRYGLKELGRAGDTSILAVAPWLHSLSYLAVLTVVLFNLGIPWLRWAGLGIVANFVVIAANGGRMPVQVPPGAMPGNEWALGVPGDYMHTVMTNSTRLPWLGDWIYEHVSFLPTNSFSPGDILLAVAVLLAVQAIMAGDWVSGKRAGRARTPFI